MKLSALPQIYRHFNRWREIVTVLSKYELAGWIGRVGPEFIKDFLKSSGGEALARLPWNTRVRMALSELGPTFIKLGQVLSTRPDLVGASLADELQSLQARAPAHPMSVVREQIESELHAPLATLFSEFCEEPEASASIAQVHRARLTSGEEVVVKVQHPDIERKILVDLEILAGLAILAEQTAELRNYRPRSIVREFQRTMRRELDFRREMRNIQFFEREFARDPNVHIPRTYPRYCTARILTMERLVGVKFADLPRCAPPDFDPQLVARRAADLCLEMIFGTGVYHADPHPSNVMVLPGNVIGLLDFGMIGRLDEPLQEDLCDMLAAVAEGDASLLTAAVVRAGQAPPGFDRSGLESDVSEFVAHYGSMPLDQFDLSGALREIAEIIRRYNIVLPAPLALLLKVLITLEGTAKAVSPEFCLIEVMAPYQRRLMLRRFSPRTQWRKLRRFSGDLSRLIAALPRGLTDILQQVQSGKFDVHLDHRGLEPSVNRLVLGMIASALFLGSALLLHRGLPPVIFEQISLPGLAGAVLSFVLGLRLWRAINRSGRLDQR